jgi:hypothetical protein
MKKSLLFTSMLVAGIAVNAQDIYAATGLTKGKIEFNDFRTLDANNLNTSNILLSKADKLTIENSESNATKACSCGKYIAAMTVSDKGELVYMPMNNNRVAFVDASSKQGSIVEVTDSKIEANGQATYFARMATGSDGFMYALNNIGSELLKISSNGTVVNLGAIPEMEKFANESGIPTSVYGGDMIADSFGNLYAISAAGNVFKINPSKMTSDFLGKIKGLPEKYTVNGAAVMADGKVLLATTADFGLYTLDFSTLEANFRAEYSVPVYDLASKHLLRHTELKDMTNSNYSLYPTIVKNSELNIVAKTNDPNQLNVVVYNLNNKQVYSNTLTLRNVGEYKVSLSGALQPGIYILKATNQMGVEVINTKFTLVK